MKGSRLAGFLFRRNHLLAASSGILLILSFPNPFNTLAPHLPSGVLAWVALVPLFLCLEGKPYPESLFIGGVAGFVYFLGTLYWVVVAMHNYGGIPYPFSLLILITLTLYLALFVTLFSGILAMIRSTTRWSLPVLAPPLWVVTEYLRSTLLTGFPWENLGYSQYLALPVIQIADLAGVYGVSFLVVLVNCLVVSGIIHWRDRGKMPWKPILLLALLLLGVLTYGFMRIHREELRIAGQTPIKIALVQGNIDQSIKWEPAYQNETVEVYRTLTHHAAEHHPDLVIWPETAVPFFFPIDQPLSQVIERIPSEIDTYLLFGSPFYQGDDLLNSAYLLSPDGKILDRYDKIHLVPFGEYIPLSSLISRVFYFLRPLAENIGEFASGNKTHGIVVFSIPQGKFGALICYEIIFPDLNRQFIKKGADFLVTITNDAWFGKTSAPFQHFSMATFRAVENRVFIARAANTGISGIIDSTGKIVIQSDIFTRKTLAGQVFLRGPNTFYTRCGDVFVYMCAAWSLIILGGGLIARRRDTSHPVARL